METRQQHKIEKRWFAFIIWSLVALLLIFLDLFVDQVAVEPQPQLADAGLRLVHGCIPSLIVACVVLAAAQLFAPLGLNLLSQVVDAIREMRREDLLSVPALDSHGSVTATAAPKNSNYDAEVARRAAQCFHALITSPTSADRGADVAKAAHVCLSANEARKCRVLLFERKQDGKFFMRSQHNVDRLSASNYVLADSAVSPAVALALTSLVGVIEAGDRFYHSVQRDQLEGVSPTLANRLDADRVLVIRLGRVDSGLYIWADGQIVMTDGGADADTLPFVVGAMGMLLHTEAKGESS